MQRPAANPTTLAWLREKLSELREVSAWDSPGAGMKLGGAAGYGLALILVVTWALVLMPLGLISRVVRGADRQVRRRGS